MRAINAVTRMVMASVLMLLAGVVYAQQAYPNRPITFIAPYGPGTGNDIIARIVAQKVTETWGHPLVVENRPGATGGIGLEATAKAPPDGYTIVIASTSQIINQHVSKVRYDFLRDFAPVSLSGELPYVIAVASDSPAKAIKDLVAMAKSKPGKLNYGGQVGSVPQFLGVMLKSAGGIDIAMIPYKSTIDAEADVVAGRVEILFTTMATAVRLVKSGRIRALGVAGDKRAAVLPDVPTMAEAGFPTLDVSVQFFILGPAGTPKPIFAALNSEIVKAIATQDVRDRLAAAGVEPKSSSPEEVTAVLKSEVARWGKIVKESGVRLD
jgi:tripartite-type tricarboxylate transporter receptor subunit TctC